MGCRLALANASIAIGELSVRITDPMDMKKLGKRLATSASECEKKGEDLVPKRGGRSHHILPQSSHHTIGASAKSHDVRRP